MTYLKYFVLDAGGAPYEFGGSKPPSYDTIIAGQVVCVDLRADMESAPTMWSILLVAGGLGWWFADDQRSPLRN